MISNIEDAKKTFSEALKRKEDEDSKLTNSMVTEILEEIEKAADLNLPSYTYHYKPGLKNIPQVVKVLKEKGFICKTREHRDFEGLVKRNFMDPVKSYAYLELSGWMPKPEEPVQAPKPTTTKQVEEFIAKQIGNTSFWVFYC